MGDAAQRNASKGGRVFCDEQCACEWKSIHYASANHKPFEESRKRTKAKRAIEAEAARRRAEEREVARLIKPVNAKTPGYVTCIECSKTVWVEQHSDKKYCSEKCSRKAYRRSENYKAIRRESKRNRDHIKRSKGIGDRITIPDLMKKYKTRCVNCKTICVKPEGYNWNNEATIDHVLPIAAGGLHIWSNVQLLCRRCNVAKGATVAHGTQLMLDLRFK
jgi:5-methylcytosine-specific restriction endonuclease McrA